MNQVIYWPLMERTVKPILNRYLAGATTLILSVVFVSHAFANADGFSAWIKAFEKRAANQGISQSTLHSAMRSAEFLPRVIELDRKQPEHTRTFNEYKRDVVSQVRIDEGRRLYRHYYSTLKEIESQYGVPAPVIVALWGIETNYGKNTGGFSVVDSLATLAYEGRRHEFFERELIAALKIIQAGHISVVNMRGSWAGAMGQNQFMPTSFMKFAVDGNGDNRKDIWGTKRDVFASTANYLKTVGWTPNERWGRAVRLPSGFDTTKIGLHHKKSINAWAMQGVTLPSGDPLPTSVLQASIVRPQDSGRDAYLAYHNYKSIMHWNKSTYFATSVGLLSDAIAAGI